MVPAIVNSIGLLRSAMLAAAAGTGLLVSLNAAAQDLTEPGARAGATVQVPVEGERPLADDSGRVRGMEHLGLKLGMPADAVQETFDMQVDLVAGAQDPPVVRYYEAEAVTEGKVKLLLRFDREERLYFIQSTQVLKPGIGVPALKQRVESKYGPADVAGRMGLGQYRIGYEDPGAQLNVFADIPLAGRDAPTVIRVELVDHALEAANEAAFRAKALGEGTSPAPKPVPDSRVKL